MFTTIKEIHSYGTRSSRKGNVNVTFCKTKRKLMSISIIGAKLRNQLHANVQNVKTINMFKQRIKNMFISSYN
jgi:hypothetical protein